MMEVDERGDGDLVVLGAGCWVNVGEGGDGVGCGLLWVSVSG